MKTILEKQKPQELTLNNILEHQQKPQELTLNNLSLNSNQLHYNLHQFKDQKSHEEKPLNVDQFLKNMQLSSEDVIMAPYFKDQPLDYEFKDLVNAAQRQPFKTITNPAEQLKESFAMQYQEVFKQSEGQRPMILDVAVGRQSPLDGDGMNGINAPIVSGNNMPPMVSSAAQIAPPTAINSRRIPFKRRSLQHVGHEEIISLYFDNEPEVLPGSCDSSVTTTLVSPSFGDSYSESSSPQMFTRSLSRASSRDGIYRQRSMSFQHGAPQRIYTPENSGSVYSTTVNPLYTRDSTSSLFYPDGNPSLYHQDSNSSLSTSAYTPDSNSVCTPDSSSVYNQDVSLGLNFAEVSFPKPRERAHSLATPTNFSTQYPSLKRRSVSGIIDLDHSHMKRVQKVAKTRKKQKSLDTISVSEFSASPDSTPRQQKLKGPDDLYTPRWVRYQGAQKEGLCDMCEPGKWLQLKNSAFWYHKQFIHGISSVNGRPFPRPLKTRLVWMSETVSGKLGLILTSEGLCPVCNSWLLLTKHKKYHSQTFPGGSSEALKNFNLLEGDVLSHSPLKILVGLDLVGNPRNLPKGFSLGRDKMGEMLNESLAISWYRHSFKCSSSAANKTV